LGPTYPVSSTRILPLSLHDALPISVGLNDGLGSAPRKVVTHGLLLFRWPRFGRQVLLGCGYQLIHAGHQFINRVCDKFEVEGRRSEEHTSELQSPCTLVCRLLLEKK